MLAVDTNVVVRYLTGDHPEQALIARKLVEGNDIKLLCTVMLETEWVLRSLYAYPRDRVHAGLLAFAGIARVTAEHPQRVRLALDWFGQGMDFADALHLAGCVDDVPFATFDRKLVAAARKARAGKVLAL